MFRKKKNKELKENLGQDKLAGKIAGLAIKVQTKFTEYMNKSFSGLSIRRMKVLLVLFCLFWGSISIYFIAHAVWGSNQHEIKIDQVKIIQHINQPDKMGIENRVDAEIYLQIQDYKRYMDSSHQQIRPGMLDSMNVLEQIYLSQQKNEANEK